MICQREEKATCFLKYLVRGKGRQASVIGQNCVGFGLYPSFPKALIPVFVLL